MTETRFSSTTIMAVLVLLVGVLALPGCGSAPDVQELSEQLAPLQVRRTGGKVESITFAQAMDWHHAHHTDAVTSATPATKTSKAHKPAAKDHDDGICIGVATGYQAIRYAAGRLFADEIPDASDLAMSIRGPMRGVRDMLTLYSGTKPPPAEPKDGKMSPASFTFTARRVSTGRTLTFRLRDGLIPPRFFALKNRGVSCGHHELEALKATAARKILSLPPQECFESIVP